MNVSRLVSLAAAIAISAVEWAALFSPSLQPQPVQAISASASGEASDGSLPVVVITAHRQL